MDGQQIIKRNTLFLWKINKSLNSIIYIKENYKVLNSFIEINDFLEEKMSTFFIYCCAFFDFMLDFEYSKNSKICKNKKQYDKMHKTMFPNINYIYYNRDKLFAHKDVEYKMALFDDIEITAKKMKEVCSTISFFTQKYKKVTFASPDNCFFEPSFEFNFFSYDELLFRYINGITPEKESKYKEKVFLKNNKETKFPVKEFKHYSQLNHLNGFYTIHYYYGLKGLPQDVYTKDRDFMLGKEIAKNNFLYLYLKVDLSSLEEKTMSFLNIFNLIINQ